LDWPVNNDDSQVERHPPPVGLIEPHAGLLTIPSDGQLLFKRMSTENLIRSIRERYLHFNRVDLYSDFPQADGEDGAQLPLDREVNTSSHFENAPEFTAAHYYDRSRARTYAWCASLQKPTFQHEDSYGDICVVFDFGKLRNTLNQHLSSGHTALMAGGIRCHQIFSINYGIVEYVDRAVHRANSAVLPNPIQYTYLKDKEYQKESELRVSLSAIGLGRFIFDDGREMDFPPDLQMTFDFRRAIENDTIVELMPGPQCDVPFLRSELEKLHIRLAED
jgi:hypothetical protein